tara:strand:- start:19096 stop:20607 length:1512 start_codon:yes stop_codon:yes gene_type:complete
MSLDDFNICLFEGRVREIKDEEFELFGLSQGAIQEAAESLLPDDFNPDQNIDVLPVVFNLAKVNEFNKNGDGIDAKTAVAAVKRFINKPINIEHKKDKIVGHMINASFSDREFDFKNNDIESYANKTEPFYMNAAGLIYKQVYPELAEAIVESSDKEEESYQSISTSWELAFKDFEVAVGSKLLQDSTIAEGAEKEDLKQYVKGLGGKGEDPDGKPVNRLIVGQTYPLGAALTRNPAAAVKGIYTSENEPEDKNIEKISLNTNINVKRNKLKNIFNMDKEQFDQLITQLSKSVASAVKEGSEAKTVSETIRDTLVEHNESWTAKMDVEREAKAQAEAELEEMKSSFKQTKEELDALKSEVEAKAAVDLFNDRMNFIDNDYDLNEKEMALVTAEVKELGSSEEDFNSYKEKLSVIFAHKLKKNIEAQEAEIKARIDEAVANREEGEEDGDPEEGEDEEAEEAPEEALEAEGDEAEASLPNNNGNASEKLSLIEKLKESFEVEVS